jgi:type VI protein secretion system component VasK
MQWLFYNWHVVATWLASVLSSIIAALAVLGITYNYFGERIVGHFFDKRLEEFKHDRARDLEKFKHQQNQEIEQLKGQLGYLSDRGQRSNEREYTETARIWERAVELYYATNMAIILTSNILP